jgi:hypothetical protein
MNGGCTAKLVVRTGAYGVAERLPWIGETEDFGFATFFLV